MGHVYILSNNHVLANNARVGDPIIPTRVLMIGEALAIQSLHCGRGRLWILMALTTLLPPLVLRKFLNIHSCYHVCVYEDYYDPWWRICGAC